VIRDKIKGTSFIAQVFRDMKVQNKTEKAIKITYKTVENSLAYVTPEVSILVAFHQE